MDGVERLSGLACRPMVETRCVVVRFAQVGLLQRMARPHAHWCMCVSQACFPGLWSTAREQHFLHTDGAGDSCQKVEPA